MKKNFLESLHLTLLANLNLAIIIFLIQHVTLADDKGQKFQSHGFNWTNGTPTTVQGTFMFGDGGNAQLGKPHKLIYYGWVTMQHQVEFEFKDLPLP